MLRGREPAAGVLVLLLATACPGRGEGTTGGMSRPAGGLVSPFKSGIGHVGNEVRGIEAMPDYDAEAKTIRTRVDPQLPNPLPQPKAACVSMLDGARKYYVDIEGEDSTSVKTMETTREADLEACVAQTSPAAATCVALMMALNEGEFPWVLDQCSRAYPRQEG